MPRFVEIPTPDGAIGMSIGTLDRRYRVNPDQVSVLEDALESAGRCVGTWIYLSGGRALLVPRQIDEVAALLAGSKPPPCIRYYDPARPAHGCTRPGGPVPWREASGGCNGFIAGEDRACIYAAPLPRRP